MKIIAAAALIVSLLIWWKGYPRTANGWRWFILVAAIAIASVVWIDIATGLGWWIVYGLAAVFTFLAALGLFMSAINAEDQSRSTRWGDQ